MPETTNQQTEKREETTSSRQLEAIRMNSLSSFTQVTKDTMDATKAVSDLGTSWPAIVTLALGPIMIIFALAFKLELLGQGIGNLSSAEFITVVLTGAMLVVLGGLIHLYHYKARHELRRRIQDTAARTLDAQIQASDKATEFELWRLKKDLRG